ncbi:hypothetical protein [Lewinella sp. IMCC34191]|uniref:hypothetical protein n=1 Tax=Lewinella sp. IMCC34191 TaxID=2259172 RepID=UPI000E27B629|nr:hypothetical protein [Lewinella sp. IMCC34191]
MPLYRSLLFGVLWLFAAPAAGQLELNPYVGLFSGENQLTLIGATDGLDIYDAQRYAVGLDVLFGAGQLAPTAGLLYRPGKYESRTAEDFTQHRLHVPLGLAYRVIAPDFDINLVPALAVVPGFRFGDGPANDQSISWSGRAGIRVYLDWFTLGVHYFRTFTDSFSTGEHREGRVLYTVGARF